MAKKKKQKRNFDGLVYSTDPDFEPDHYEGEEEETLPPRQQDLRVSLRRHKGNKQATIVTGFIGSEEDLKALGKYLKTRCGTGGSVKDGEVIVQGDKRKQVGEALTAEGYPYKFSGG